MTNRTAANRYARALLDVAVKEARGGAGGASAVSETLQRIEQQLAAFAELFNQHPTLEKVLLNPAVPVPQKRATVIALTDRAQALPIVAKLLVVLAERDRLVLVPDLLAQYRERLLDYQNVVLAEVTTATPLGTDRAKAIEASLARVTGRTVRLATAVDPAIIGGVVARIGSTIYDGSVTRQLQKMKARLVESV
jgi:F-type H+-transporting ATPase subunit delta